MPYSASQPNAALFFDVYASMNIQSLGLCIDYSIDYNAVVVANIRSMSVP